MPNRIIKENICTSDNLDRLSPEEEVFFYRLIVNCDDYGRTDARPQILRAKCYPMKMDRIINKDIEAWLSALVNQKLIILYSVDGKRYLQFVTWERHQQVRAKKSKFPAPDSRNAKMISIDINCGHMSPYSESESESYSEAESYSETNTSAAPAQNLFSDFEKDFGRPLSPTEYEQITRWQEVHEPDVVKEALRRAVLNGKFNMRYIDRILLSWEKANCRTLREVMEYEEAYTQAKQGRTIQATDDDSAKKVVQLEKKRREEIIRAACDFIKLQLGPDPPEDSARELAFEYGEELVPDIIGRLYEGGRSP